MRLIRGMVGPVFVVLLCAAAGNSQNGTPSQTQTPGKIVTLPAPTNTTTNNNGIGKITTLPVTIGKTPVARGSSVPK